MSIPTFDPKELYSLVIYQLEIESGQNKEHLRTAIYLIFGMYSMLAIFLAIMSGEFIYSFGILGAPFLIILVVIYFSFENNERKYLNSIRELYVLTQDISNSTENIDKILLILKKIGNIISNKVHSKMNKTTGYKKEIFLNQIKYFLFIVTDMRFDLFANLSEQQQSLESAKSEVEKNIGGTTELESVSELQRARLDKQIEQFEELQRVLVRV